LHTNSPEDGGTKRSEHGCTDRAVAKAIQSAIGEFCYYAEKVISEFIILFILQSSFGGNVFYY